MLIGGEVPRPVRRVEAAWLIKREWQRHQPRLFRRIQILQAWPVVINRDALPRSYVDLSVVSTSLPIPPSVSSISLPPTPSSLPLAPPSTFLTSPPLSSPVPPPSLSSSVPLSPPSSSLPSPPVPESLTLPASSYSEPQSTPLVTFSPTPVSFPSGILPRVCIVQPS